MIIQKQGVQKGKAAKCATFKNKETDKFFLYLNTNTMQEGKVKFFNESKGFGFITPNNGTEEIFVHISGLQSDIRESDSVVYEVQQGKKGLNAINVRLA